MPRLLRAHFASVGHPDARLAPLTLDLRARDRTGTGADSVLWLRNGGGKSTILNLFYSLFRPERREFLGASAEGRARHLEDYVKADDLAFIVTEWDVEPAAEEGLFGSRPGRRRVVGQVLAWKDRQRSTDVSKLRRRFFSFAVGPSMGLEDLPVEGLGAPPVRSFDAFRQWFDRLRQERPELEPFAEETPRKWGEHLERIGLDPELFRYQLKMNAHEGSADEAFRFRTTEEFVRFYLEVALDPQEADQVSSNLEGFREKLERRPGLVAEQEFLLQTRARLAPLLAALDQVRAREATLAQEERDGRAVLAAVGRRREHFAARASAAKDEGDRAAADAKQAENDAARLGRWAGGLDRRALELDVTEAQAADAQADAALRAAQEDVRVGEAAEARDEADKTQAERDAKARALAAARLEQEPLRREVARAGTSLRARLAEAAAAESDAAALARVRAANAAARREALDARRDELGREAGACEAEVRQVDEWLATRGREREQLRAAGLVELREDADEALARLQARVDARRVAAAEHRIRRDEAQEKARAAAEEASAAAGSLARLDTEIIAEEKRLAAARKERDRLTAAPLLREVEGDPPDLDAVGALDRLLGAADETQQRLYAAAVDGAEDERARRALDKTGRLPPTPDTERTLRTLSAAKVTAWSAAEWLIENEPDPARRAALAASDPALWHGILVPDDASVERARGMLATHETRMPVVIARSRLEVSPADGRLVLPGHPAWWDTAAAIRFAAELGERGRRRDREREAANVRERELRMLAGDLDRWRHEWGGGRLALAESDQEQRRTSRERALAERDTARERQKAEEAREKAEERQRGAAEVDAGNAERAVERVSRFVEAYERPAEAQRARKDAANTRIAEIARMLDDLATERAAEDAAWLQEREFATARARTAGELSAERDRVDLQDEQPPDATDLVRARAGWEALRAQWAKVVSDDRLQWELDALDKKLLEQLANARTRAAGREAAVVAVALGHGAAHREAAVPRLAAAVEVKAHAGVTLANARKAVQSAPRRREADDLPPGAPPQTADEARARAERCRAERESANEQHKRQSERAGELQKEHREAADEVKSCEHRERRLVDQLGDARDVPPCELPDAVDSIVDVRVHAVREALKLATEARKEAEQRAEELRAVSADPRHEAHRSRVKERLKAPAAELAAAAPVLAADVEARLEVVRTTLGEIDEDRRLVLGALEKVAMDGAKLLQAAERASRLPAGLDAWEGEPFLRIRADIPMGQVERRARLEPYLDRLVAEGRVPDGRKLVLGGVLELAGQRIEATLLKPDALLRRDRLNVVEMQTFSRGQQLTVAILLYCTLAQLRAQSRGHRGRADGGVLLLDNPVGTCSSVPLLELQRTVARQMRVQLVYTTGINDPNAIATFPNTVRLRNHHRAQGSGDLHVTLEPGVESVRIVAT